MPTVLDIDGFQVRVLLPPREHGPPHVHVYKAGAVVVINLPNGTQPSGIRSVSHMKNADVVAAFHLVEENVKLLLAAWSKIMASKLSDAEILAQIPAARAREALARKQGLRAVSARYDRRAERIVLEMTNGYLFAFPVRAIPVLRTATAAERARVTIDRAGSALRWDALDVDLSVPGLLLSAVGVAERRSDVASMLGQATSESKAAASRANGAKGGRPRKAVAAETPGKATQVRATAKRVAASVRRVQADKH
jgi:FAD/FMN-containing dehydrogenase